MKPLPIATGLLAAAFLLFSSCSKNECSCVDGQVELYLLESFETIGNSCAIDESSVVTLENPLISYTEFISYDAREYTFTVTEKAKVAIDDLDHSVFGIAFAVVADEQLIYTGYFWPGYSSASCQWIVIDPVITLGENELRVQLGYPGLFEGSVIPDERNNQLILDIFKRDGKLIH